VMFDWAQRSSVGLQFIQPGKPSQNGFCESFNGTKLGRTSTPRF